jgi:hypothetical protein
MSMTIWLESHRYCQLDVMACLPNCDDPIRDCVILLHCLALVIDSLGGFITDGRCTWIMKMEIIMMYRLMEMEIPKVTMGYTKSYK